MPRIGWLVLALAAGLAGTAPAPARATPKAARGDDGSSLIAGTWAGVRGAERLVFQAGGLVRSCFAAGHRGNASIGRWWRLAAGRYEIEFTHTASADCSQPARPLRRHPASIVGQVRVDGGELALFVSGEFPPDLYRPLAAPPGR